MLLLSPCIENPNIYKSVKNFTLVIRWNLFVIEPKPEEIKPTLSQIEPNIKKLGKLKF